MRYSRFVFLVPLILVSFVCRCSVEGWITGLRLYTKEKPPSLVLLSASPAPTTRRQVLLSTTRTAAYYHLVATAAILLSQQAPKAALAANVEIASERLTDRPYAPTVEALVPATQIRFLLRQAVLDARQEDDTTTNRLAALLEDPNQNNNKKRSKKGTASTVVLPFSQLSGHTVRSALNVFTANLRFADSYVLTASPETRKQLIRNEQLPDVKSVITADLDLRDLYRNQVQTTVEDLQYEMYKNNESPDREEIQRLLVTATQALDAWFGMIDPYDIQQAEKKLEEIMRLEK